MCLLSNTILSYSKKKKMDHIFEVIKFLKNGSYLLVRQCLSESFINHNFFFFFFYLIEEEND